MMGVGLTLLAACDKKGKEPEPLDTSDPNVIAEDGSDSVATEIDTELITGSLVAGGAVDGLRLASTDVNGTDLSTREVGDGAKALYFPRGCLDAVNDPATSTVTYTFKNVPGALSRGCTGPNGLLHIVGQVKATYKTEPGKLILDLVGTGIEVNRATIDWSAHAEIVADGANRTMTWKGQLTGETPRKRAFSRTNQKVVQWRLGERCYAVSGTSEGDVSRRALKTEITSFRRCAGACPEAGGRIVVTDLTKQKRVELSFDGSNVATFTAPNGNQSRVQMLCNAN